MLEPTTSLWCLPYSKSPDTFLIIINPMEYSHSLKSKESGRVAKSIEPRLTTLSLAADIHVECTNTMNYPVYQIPSKVVVGMASYPHGELNHAIFVVKQKNELFIGRPQSAKRWVKSRFLLQWKSLWMWRQARQRYQPPPPLFTMYGRLCDFLSGDYKANLKQ